jgi:hypothetical protein
MVEGAQAVNGALLIDISKVAIEGVLVQVQ